MRRGRPRLDPEDVSIRLALRMPTKQYDRVYRVARQQRMTLSQFVRAAVRDEVAKYFVPPK